MRSRVQAPNAPACLLAKEERGCSRLQQPVQVTVVPYDLRAIQCHARE